MKAQRFFITGANSGFGREIAKAAAAEGHDVVGTVRSDDAAVTLATEVPSAYQVRLDVTDFASIPTVVSSVERGRGPVDVLINNAGYGHEGTIEESPLEEMIRQFNVNVFGAVAVAKAFLPFFRARRSGLILNVSSMVGMISFPGIGYYTASKHALQGFSNVLKAEVAPFGIRVTALCPGSFRTEWAGRSMVRSERTIADYDELFNPIREGRQARSGKQPGLPEELAKLVLNLIDVQDLPSQLTIGRGSYDIVEARLAAEISEIWQWKGVGASIAG